MDPIFKFPASPGTPLFPVSPERANRQQLPHSPSLPQISHIQNDPFVAHARGNSDVQGKVAQFNNLSKEAAQRRKDNEAALRRAVLGREEAESETRRLKEENRLLRQDVEEGRARERRVGERMEGIMEELQRSKETHAHAQAIYEKEVRRARKEAFKSSSALVKIQEELKSARNKYTLMREEVDVQRRKVEAREQEAFAAQHLLVDFQEELDKVKQQNKVVEGQRDALKTALKGEEVARIAAEGAIGLPACSDDDEFASPKKRGPKHDRESLKENVDPEAPQVDEELLILKEHLTLEKRMRLRADDQVHFMKMECQFQCCSCRVAERQGVEYIHDDTLAKQMGEMAAKIVEEYAAIPEKSLEPTQELTEEPAKEAAEECAQAAEQDRASTPTRPPLEQRETSEQLLNFSPATGTFHTVPFRPIPSSPEHILVPSRPATPPPQQPIPPPARMPTSPLHETPTLIFPVTPRPLPNPPARTISYTKTVTIPLKDDLPFSPAAPMTPGGISREEALEQIRQRRGRARSIAAGNGTPRKRMVEVGELRRDISAPGRV